VPGRMESGSPSAQRNEEDIRTPRQRTAHGAGARTSRSIVRSGDPGEDAARGPVVGCRRNAWPCVTRGPRRHGKGHGATGSNARSARTAEAIAMLQAQLSTVLVRAGSGGVRRGSRCSEATVARMRFQPKGPSSSARRWDLWADRLCPTRGVGVAPLHRPRRERRRLTVVPESRSSRAVDSRRGSGCTRVHITS
jgi:hypothetical protein